MDIVNYALSKKLRKYIDSALSSGSEQVQSDWLEQDETAPGYVKNRPFYDGSWTLDTSNVLDTVTVNETYKLNLVKISDDPNNFYSGLQPVYDNFDRALTKTTDDSGRYDSYEYVENDDYKETMCVVIKEECAVTVYLGVNVFNVSSLPIGIWVRHANDVIASCYVNDLNKIDSKFIPPSVMTVTFTQNDDGTFQADNTYDEIISAIQQNVYVKAIYDSTILPLTYCGDDRIYFQISDICCDLIGYVMFVINSDDIIDYMIDEFYELVGATSSDDGMHGIVPAPSAGDQDKFLKGDGTWGEIPTAQKTIVNISNTSSGITSDMTYNEIMDAYNSGNEVIANVSTFAGGGFIAELSNTTNYILFTSATGQSVIITSNNSISIDWGVYVKYIDVQSNFLEFGRTDEYAPTSDYSPATKKYVDDSISSIPSQVQSDWNQNDESASDYIKNRPFYKMDYTILLEKTTIETDTQDGDYWKSSTNIDGAINNLNGSENLTVVFDDVEYNNVSMSSDYLGGGVYAYTIGGFPDYPFKIWIYGSPTLYSTESGNHTICIIDKSKSSVVTIPIKYLPTVSSITSVEGYIPTSGAVYRAFDNYLSKFNYETYTPTGDYQPATKKYVDDSIDAMPPSVMTVTITQNDDGTYSADKTFEEISEAYDSGVCLHAVMPEDTPFLYNLVAYSSDASAIFMFTFPGETEGRFIIITKENAVNLDTISNSVFEGASSNTNGHIGAVPAPSAGDQDKFLKGDGTWREIPQQVMTVTVTQNDDGTFSADKTFDDILTAYNNDYDVLAKYNGKIYCGIRNQIEDESHMLFMFYHMFIDYTDEDDEYNTYSICERFISFTYSSEIGDAIVNVDDQITSFPVFSGEGSRGLVPNSSTNDQDKFLKGDGTWGEFPLSFNDSGELVVTLNGISKTFVPKS